VEGFELTRLDMTGVSSSYMNWAKDEVVKDLKEEMFYVSED